MTRQSLFKYVQRLAILAVILNLFVISIPHCEKFLSLDISSGQSHDSDKKTMSCHDMKTKTIASDQHCRCSPLKFMPFKASRLEIFDFIAFQVQSERVLLFPWKNILANFLPATDPPYPKA